MGLNPVSITEFLYSLIKTGKSQKKGKLKQWLLTPKQQSLARWKSF
jgi:hypothetical protein